MHSVIETEGFAEWMANLRDGPTRIRLGRRIDKARRGNFGDVKSVGGGVFEMREAFGPGWRMYYVERSGALIIMLGGGDKSSQTADIKKAVKLAQELQ